MHISFFVVHSLHKLDCCFAGSLFPQSREPDLMSFINIKEQIWSILKKKLQNLIMPTQKGGTKLIKKNYYFLFSINF